jgi:hypothetical protein
MEIDLKGGDLAQILEVICGSQQIVSKFHSF